MRYILLGAGGQPYESDVKGQWGGHRRTRIYGRLDCRSALRAIASGGYARHRVFFADEATAIAAGYRPCAVCCPDRYQAWKATRPLDSGWPSVIHVRPRG
ncbi:MAG: Ada metal-binding domain-containing protein [Trebonia sp.]